MCGLGFIVNGCRTSQKLTAYTSMKAMKLRRSIKADMFATNIYSLLQFIYSQPLFRTNYL